MPDKPENLPQKLRPSAVRAEHIRILMQTEEKRKEYAEFLKDQNSKVAALQLQCPHIHQKFWSDPSGNQDSAYCCPDCGKQSKRKL